MITADPEAGPPTTGSAAKMNSKKATDNPAALLKRSAVAALKAFDMKIVRNAAFDDFVSRQSTELARFNSQQHRMINYLAFLRSIDSLEVLQTALQNCPSAQSQLGQDLFVLSHLNFKENGYFIEFGATNGIDLSNTYLLEKEFHWSGILAEPGRSWHGALRENRLANVDTRCVWRDSNSRLIFNEASSAEYSTIKAYNTADMHAGVRTEGKEYDVATVSLLDLIEGYGAPKIIDYLSIDTEGSEFDILNAFDFSRYRFRVITCEHNYTDMRGKIFDLLSKNGYTRILEDHSQFDDWYVWDNP